jgi:lipopolysaccharide biosynthesis glycosyltransferase
MTATEVVRIAIATDDRYAMPAAASVRSVIDTLEEGTTLETAVLSCDLSNESRERLLASWDDSRCSVRFVDVDAEPFTDLPVTSPVNTTVTRATYLRLTLSELLPADWSRVIYLDVDTITRRPLTQLWRTDLAGRVIAAVRDGYIPMVSSRHGLARWQELGLDPDQAYFNTGVLLIDVDRWRGRDVYRHALDYLRAYRDDVRLFDQDALNAVLHDSWLPLDATWNVTGYWHNPARRAGRYATILQDAHIRHFAGPRKPWGERPRAADDVNIFYASLRRTVWQAHCPPHESAVTAGGNGWQGE